MRRLSRVLATAAFALALAPASASAIVGSVSGGVLSVTGDPGVDTITITLATGDYHVDDTAGPTPEAGAGCTRVADKLRCNATGVSSFVVDLGGDNDLLTNLTMVPATVYGGPGNDKVTGGAAADVIDGGDGDDELIGGWGNDILRADPGADKLNGDTGTDTVDYSKRAAPIRATLGAGGSDDGAVGEGDELLGVETVLGGSGGDAFVGTNGPDRFVGGLGGDSFQGGAGADRIEAADGQADSGYCGAGVDSVTFDVLDVFDSSCEGWTPAPSPDDDGASSDTGSAGEEDGSDDGGDDEDSGSGDSDDPNVFETPIAVTFGSAPAPFDVKRGTVALALSCADDAAAGCTGKVTLALPSAVAKGRAGVVAARRGAKRRRKSKAVKIGSRRFRLAPGKEANVAVRLSRRGRRALGSRRRSRVKATIEMNSSTGKRVETRTIVVERRVTRRPKPRKPTRRRR